MRHDIPKSKRFETDVIALSSEIQKDAAYTLNDRIAGRRFCQVLTARCLILQWFLKTIQEKFPRRSVNEFKRHWLFLQLKPKSFLIGGDVFLKLSEVLKDASDEFLLTKTDNVYDHLDSLRSEFGLDEDFYIVIDEAQAAANSMLKCFRSDQNKEIQRPVLKSLVKTWRDLVNELPIIISGTGLSIDLVNEVVASAVVKSTNFHLATNTGAFDDQDSQSKYMLRYMPPHVAKSDSGKTLIGRAWEYCRGRYAPSYLPGGI